MVEGTVKIWFLITEEERQMLITFQDKYFPYTPLTISTDDRVFPDLKEPDFIENLEEIDKEMRKRPKHRRESDG